MRNGTESETPRGARIVTDFVEPATGIFVEEAFRHLLSREAVRATRYQDFFSVCLVRPDTPEHDEGEDVAQRHGLLPQVRRSKRVIVAVLLTASSIPNTTQRY